jgi:hypothetical protein
MPLQRAYQCLWEHSHPILRTFPVMDDDLLVGEVAVLDAQACTLHDAQSSTIQQACHEARRALQVY